MKSPVNKNLIFLTVLLLTVLFVSGCAQQPNTFTLEMGFLHGLAHGFFMLFSLMGSFFSDVRIYAYPNAGTLYDVGYVLGAVLFFGIIFASTR